jgi:hypothetical protein
MRRRCLTAVGVVQRAWEPPFARHDCCGQAKRHAHPVACCPQTGRGSVQSMMRAGKRRRYDVLGAEWLEPECGVIATCTAARAMANPKPTPPSPRLSASRLVSTLVPTLTFRSRAVVDAAILTSGDIGTAGAIARYLGLPSRFALATMLKREGLPPLHKLKSSVRVLAWVREWEHSGASLCSQALRAGLDPAACYRAVRRTTGLSWSTVRGRGSRWVLVQTLGRSGANADRERPPSQRSAPENATSC